MNRAYPDLCDLLDEHMVEVATANNSSDSCEALQVPLSNAKK